jgi:solute:Na+ symporter, SSS family
LSSIATIVSHDIIKVVYIGAGDRLLAILGRFSAITALVVAMAVSFPLLGHVDQAFQYIQNYNTFFSPGIVVIFVLGMFWQKTNETGALLAAGGSVLISAVLSIVLPDMAFLHRTGWVFLACLVLAVGGSLAVPARTPATTIDVKGTDFSTGLGYNISAAVIAAILVLIYWYWW